LNKPPNWTDDDFEFDKDMIVSWDWNVGVVNVEQECYYHPNQPMYYLSRQVWGAAGSGFERFKGKAAESELRSKGYSFPSYVVIKRAKFEKMRLNYQATFTVTARHDPKDVIKDVWLLNPPVGWNPASLKVKDGEYEWSNSSAEDSVSQSCTFNQSDATFHFSHEEHGDRDW